MKRSQVELVFDVASDDINTVLRNFSEFVNNKTVLMQTVGKALKDVQILSFSVVEVEENEEETEDA